MTKQQINQHILDVMDDYSEADVAALLDYYLTMLFYQQAPDTEEEVCIGEIIDLWTLARREFWPRKCMV